MTLGRTELLSWVTLLAVASQDVYHLRSGKRNVFLCSCVNICDLNYLHNHCSFPSLEHQTLRALRVETNVGSCG